MYAIFLSFMVISLPASIENSASLLYKMLEMWYNIPILHERRQTMISGDTRAKLDSLLTLFWNNGMTNPLTVTEQLTHLLFIRLLEMRSCASHRYTPALTWSEAAKLPEKEMFSAFAEKIFPEVKKSFPEYMDDALFLVPSPKVLEKAVTVISSLSISGEDIMGDVYEYLLSKLSSSGTNGQFRTPRPVIQLMAELMQPSPEDTVCDPAMGSAGFLCAAAEYSFKRYGALPELSGWDTDRTMHRIGAMNLVLHGVNAPDVKRGDSLSVEDTISDAYSMVLANPPFTGSLDRDSVSPDLLVPSPTKKTELLFLRLFLRILRSGGRCASIVPEGVLFGTSHAHLEIRRTLVEDNRLEAVIALPGGTFRPYAGISTAILIFTKSGKTDNVWFCDSESFSRETAASDIAVNFRRRTDHKDRQGCFLVSREEISANDYVLSLRTYRSISENSPSTQRSSAEILCSIQELESKVSASLERLGGLING